MSLVSIVIPLFDTRPYVRRAVESALAQTYAETEVIVVDDGSTDGGAEEIRDFVDGGRVRLIERANGGTAAARNSGWRAGRGELLHFLDSDDEVDPRLVARLVERRDPGDPLSVAYCDFRRVDLRGETLPGSERTIAGSRRHLEGDLLPALTLGNFLQSHCVLLARALVERVGGFDERFPHCEDYHLWLRLFAIGASARFVDEPLARYRSRPGSGSSDPDAMRRWSGEALASAASAHPAAFAAALPAMREEADWIRESVRRDGEEHVRRCRAHVASLEALLRAPEAVVAAVSRLRSEAAAETEALWRDAHRRLERCRARARELERELAARDGFPGDRA